MHIRPRHQLATEHHDPVKLLRATPYNKKPKRSKTTAQLADRSQASIVANQICRLKWMPLNKITSDIRRSRRGLELCGLASLQNKERQFCVFLPEKGFPACNVFVQTDSQQATQIIVRLFSFCWFRNRTTKSVRGMMNSDPGNQDVQPRTLPAFWFTAAFRNSCVPSLAGFGLRYRYYDSC